MRARAMGSVMVLLAVIAAGLTVVAAPAGAVSAPEVVAEGLNHPYKLSFGPEGDLFVAEAGMGGDESCVETEGGPDGAGGQRCFGRTGSVTRVTGGDGAQQRLVAGLPSTIDDGGEVIGPTDVAVDDQGRIFVSVGLGMGGVPLRSQWGEGGELMGTILQSSVATPAQTTLYADIAAFEAEHDPDADQPGAENVGEGGDTNPFGIELVDGVLYVADAGGNSLLRVDDGEVSLATAFPFRTAQPPGAPPGATMPLQPVPTEVVQAPDGTLHVSELTGFPFPTGGARIYAVSPTGERTVVHEGFTLVIDIAYADDGTLYVVEFSSRSLIEGPPSSRIVQVRRDGTRKTLLAAGDLQGVATGATVGPDGMLYVSLGLGAPGSGRVIRVDPTVARDPATAAACPPQRVPGSGLTDLDATVHREAIECLAWWEALRGVTETAFAPGRTATRGQIASIVARVLEAGGAQLPASPPDAFDDDDGSPHELRINQLAAMGVVHGFADGTFRPQRPVSRAALASLLVRAYEGSFGALAAGTDAFTDDEGSVHEENINKAAARGWVHGTAERQFSPAGTATRGQLASIVARVLATLVVEGHAELPGAG